MNVYEEARQKGQQVLAEAILSIAERIIRAEGAGGLSMRRIASEAGCSTMVLYTLFGNKEGLIAALYAEGFRRLRSAIDAALAELAAQGGDHGPVHGPVPRIHALCEAYRANALANPVHYGIMFGNLIPNFAPGPAQLAIALETIQPLAVAVGAGVAAGAVRGLPGKDAVAFAMLLWSAAHGFVSLELAGYYSDRPDPAEMYHALVNRTLGI